MTPEFEVDEHGKRVPAGEPMGGGWRLSRTKAGLRRIRILERYQRIVGRATLRQAAALMREEHGPDHKRHEMWSAMADWLEVTAQVADTSSGAFHAAFAAADAYLKADR